MNDNRPNIWRLQAQADVPGLIKALEHGDPDIRQRAAVALRALEAYDAIPVMRAVLAKEDNPDARTIITSALVHLLEEHQEQAETQRAASPPDELTLLIEQLRSKDHDEIIHAAQALGALGDLLAVEPLMMLFNNAQMPPRVRLAAAEALIELKSPPTTVTVLVALRRPDPHLRRIAAAMLGHLEADWAVEPLAAALKDENDLVRRTAHAALKHIGTPEALAALAAHPEPLPSTGMLARPAEKDKAEPAAPVESAAPSTPPVLAAVGTDGVVQPDEPAEPSGDKATDDRPAESRADAAPDLAAANESTGGAGVRLDEPAAPHEEKPSAEAAPTPLSVEVDPHPEGQTGDQKAASDPDSPPEEQPKEAADKTPLALPDWSLEKTRPSRPGGLDEALRPPDAPITPAGDGSRQDVPSAAGDTAPVSSDGASPSGPNNP